MIKPVAEIKNITNNAITRRAAENKKLIEEMLNGDIADSILKIAEKGLCRVVYQVKRADLTNEVIVALHKFGYNARVINTNGFIEISW